MEECVKEDGGGGDGECVLGVCGEEFGGAVD